MFKTLAPITLAVAFILSWAVYDFNTRSAEAQLSAREDARDQELWKLLATDKK